MTTMTTVHHHGNGSNGGPHRPLKMNGNYNQEEEEVHPYRIRVSGKFIVTALVACILLAFSVGRAARILLLKQSPAEQPTLKDRPRYLEGYARPSLPSLTIQRGKKLPKTRYTSKNFDTSMSASSSNWLNTERNENADSDARQCSENENGKQKCMMEDEEEEDDDDDEEDEEDDVDRQDNPSGEHLMVDIKHVSMAFLNSEQRLAQAMVDLVNEAGLTLLSYHCHSLLPAGVSCVGVLLQNYVSFHTWPVEGVITFDLCVGGNIPILPTLPAIKRLFGVPRVLGETGPVMDEPEMRWSHKLRGYRPRPDSYTDLLSATDLTTHILGDLGSVMKEQVASIETDFQRIDIYDTLDTEDLYNRYQRSLAHDGSYESRNPRLFRPDRIVLLDGCMQSSLDDEMAYHEALVHPAMFTHPDPKRVAIIGGGEVATLREVLKHNTVEDAVMIEIDEMMVEASREHLPEWSNCTDFGADWCGDDPRSEIHYEDALAWFLDRFPHGKPLTEKPMDIIIMDALDPETDVPFADVLYGNDAVMQSLFDALSGNGILVMQLGESAYFNAPSEMNSPSKNRAKTTELLTRVGFQSIHAYEESHCGFLGPWTLLVAFKSYETRKSWYSNAAQINLEIIKRQVKTKSGTNPFKYFDGPTMVSYQVPPKSMETVYCRQVPKPEECVDGEWSYSPEYPNIPVSSLEVKMSKESENAGRGLFTKVDIPEDAYLSAETGCHSVHFAPSTKEMLDDMLRKFNATDTASIVAYMYGYGFVSRILGEPEVVVDSSILTFANHGCRKEYNVGQETYFDEFTVDPKVMVAEVSGKRSPKFSPVLDRHLFHNACQSLDDIKAGDEILDNYLAFTGDQDDWEEDIASLRSQCSGAAGEVLEYEKKH